MRLLLVDDHPLMREGLRAALTRWSPGAEIAEAGSGAEALALAASFRPAMSVLDINLPDMNGLELAQRIRAGDRHARILFLAAEADPWTVSEALAVGAAGYLVKSSAASELRTAIDAVLAGKLFLCGTSARALRRAERSGPSPFKSPGLAILTVREREVLRLIAEGQSTKALADELRISPKTVETHRMHIMRKLRLDNVASLTYYAVLHGFRPR